MSLIKQLSGNHSDNGKNPFEMSIEERADLELNDRGNAARLLAAFGRDLIYVHGRGWGVWDGNRFSFQSSPLKAAEIGARLPDLIQPEIQAIREKDFDEFTLQKHLDREHKKPRGKRYLNLEQVADELRTIQVSDLYKHMIKCGNVDKQVKALKACEWQVRAEILDLDSDPWLFVVTNGAIDLKKVAECEPVETAPGTDTPTPANFSKWRKGWLTPPNRSPRPTKCAGTAFVPGATCPEWEAFMALVLPETDVRQCLQRAMGALLFGANTAQIALLLRGSGGNGKSTLMTIIGEVLGNRDGYAEVVLQNRAVC